MNSENTYRLSFLEHAKGSTQSITLFGGHVQKTLLQYWKKKKKERDEKKKKNINKKLNI